MYKKRNDQWKTLLNRRMVEEALHAGRCYLGVGGSVNSFRVVTVHSGYGRRRVGGGVALRLYHVLCCTIYTQSVSSRR